MSPQERPSSPKSSGGAVPGFIGGFLLSKLAVLALYFVAFYVFVGPDGDATVATQVLVALVAIGPVIGLAVWLICTRKTLFGKVEARYPAYGMIAAAVLYFYILMMGAAFTPPPICSTGRPGG